MLAALLGGKLLMMWRSFALLGLVAATPALADEFPLRGQWEVRSNIPNYVGIVLIDSERRVTWDSPADQGKPAKYLGYVSEVTDDKIVLTLTDKVGVTKTHCDVRAAELLHCYAIRADNTRSANFLMVKVRPGPHRLTRAP